jgi:hypothetical protein
MATLSMFLKGASFMSLFLLTLGLIRPWWVLWWEATQNRLRVFKLYGGLTILFHLLGWVLDSYF